MNWDWRNDCKPAESKGLECPFFCMSMSVSIPGIYCFETNHSQTLLLSCTWFWCVSSAERVLTEGLQGRCSQRQLELETSECFSIPMCDSGSRITGVAEMTGDRSRISLYTAPLHDSCGSPMHGGPEESDFSRDGWLPPAWVFQRTQVETLRFLITGSPKSQKVVSATCYGSPRSLGPVQPDTREWEIDPTSQCREHHNCKEKELKAAVNFWMN